MPVTGLYTKPLRMIKKSKVKKLNMKSASMHNKAMMKNRSRVQPYRVSMS